MVGLLQSRLLAIVLAFAGLLQPCALQADTVAVRYTEGLVHGFLILRSLDGNTLAVGDLTQIAKSDQVTSNLVFHFKDGSINEETTVFSQRGRFQLLSYHLVQKGPAFKRPMETSLDATTGQFTVHYQDDDGKEKVLTDRLEIPVDVANGMVPTLLKNIEPIAQRIAFSMVAATPKPRIVKLAITLQGEERFLVGGISRQAMHYVVKVELGGAAGVAAPIVGKKPPDTHIWILGGVSPVILRSEGPLYQGGPIWIIELACPDWPRQPKKNSSKK